MNKFELSYSSTPLTEQEYEDFIQEYELSLPESYKSFILEHNGGVPNFSAYGDPYSDGYYIALFSRISSSVEDNNELEDDDIDSVRETIVMHQIDEANIPRNLYPFGKDQGGSFYCIDMNDMQIYKYYMDYTTEPKLVAPSFEDFIVGLEDASVYEEDD